MNLIMMPHPERRSSLRHLRTLPLLLVAWGLACSGGNDLSRPSYTSPSAEREFRAAWVATVVNIDWPSAPGLPTAIQQAEAVRILDSAASLNLNAIILQVRPQCDAIYASPLEPWSYYLTGTQGCSPEPYYDPLAFWITEAHRRGLELHAWFNPYRAHIGRGGPVTDASIVRKLPGLAKLLPDSSYWLDPSNPRTQDHSAAVVLDVVRRYDIDGVQFDDYFYPYGDTEFPDEDSWSAYRSGGGTLDRDDWRRNEVNRFIERIYSGIKRVKPQVKFGLSPFGIWRPGHPPSITGFDQYSRLYADARLWLREGWVDYWSPQLYWPVNQIPQSFPVLLGWWTRENAKGRNIWPGIFTSRLTDDRGVDEVQNEIMITRGMVPDAPGHIHFSMRALLRDSTSIRTALRNGPYRSGALVPPSPWLDNVPPPAPSGSVLREGDSLTLRWAHRDPADVFRWILYLRYGERWEYQIFPAGGTEAQALLVRHRETAPSSGGDQRGTVSEELTGIGISAVDRLGNESEHFIIPIPEK